MCVCYSHSMCTFKHYIESYMSVWGRNEIHWVMLTLALRLTNTQWHLKHKKHSTQQLLPSNCVWCSGWGVCGDKWVWMDGNVLVYLLYIWVRVNMLCVLLCFKHSSCLSQSTNLNHNKHNDPPPERQFTTNRSKYWRTNCGKIFFLDVYSVTRW